MSLWKRGHFVAAGCGVVYSMPHSQKSLSLYSMSSLLLLQFCVLQSARELPNRCHLYLPLTRKCLLSARKLSSSAASAVEEAEAETGRKCWVIIPLNEDFNPPVSLTPENKYIFSKETDCRKRSCCLWWTSICRQGPWGCGRGSQVSSLRQSGENNLFMWLKKWTSRAPLSHLKYNEMFVHNNVCCT